jgi:Na+/H+ antiporter NhaD/arsenite permease-like protein
MTLFQIIATLVFVAGYTGIAIEHKFHMNKAAWALLTGGLLWVIVALSAAPAFERHLAETGSEIFSLVVFLLAAMSLVEILVSCGVFDALRTKMLTYHMDNRKQFMVLTGAVFVLSAVVDNLTATIIMVQIARKFFKGSNLVVVTSGIIIAANAGGAFSPVGDVTTIMLWIAGKFGALQVIAGALLPGITIAVVAVLLLRRKIDNASIDSIPQGTQRHGFSKGKKIIIASASFSFVLPILFKMIHLPPVLGILTGLGLTWLLVDYLEHNGKSESLLTANIENLIQKTDIASINFFIGILLAVSALSALGILETASAYIYGPDQETSRVIIGNIAIGAISAVLDNIPLTAISIDILETTDTALWVLLAICVGAGGSLLSIGSAAGVVAMGLVRELTFKRYLQVAFVPALLSFLSGIAMWLLQWQILLLAG